MTTTKAQDELLLKLEDGWEITFKDKHYTIVGQGEDEKIWPSTFYGLYDQRLVVKLPNGNYTVSEDGVKQIRSKDK